MPSISIKHPTAQVDRRQMNEEKIEASVRLLLEGLEVDPNDRNYKDTPARVLRFYKELFETPDLDVPFFDEIYDEMVVLRNHTAWGVCPHHLLPVHYTVHCCYISSGRVMGLSKLARIVNTCIKGPMLQEALAVHVVKFLMASTAKGAGCVVIGQHCCMQMRGVKTSGEVVTSAMRGALLTDLNARQEFLALLKE